VSTPPGSARAPAPAAPHPPHPPDPIARASALVAVLAALAALGMTALVPTSACLLAVGLVAAATVALRYVPALALSSALRATLALALLAVVAVTGSRSAPDVPLLGPFELLPTGVFTALAAGALVAAVLEFGTGRGVRFGVVLTAGVLALTAALAPGPGMVPALCIGWPAALFTLARVNGVEGLARSRSGAPQAGAPARAVTRWHVLPAAAGIAVALLALLALRAGGLSESGGPGAGALGAGDGFQSGGDGRGASRSTSSYLGSTMDLRMRGTLGDSPVLSVPASSPALWRSGVLDTYRGAQWSAGDAAGERPAVDQSPGRLFLTWLLPVAGVSRDDVVRPEVAWASVVVAPGRPDAVSSDALGRSVMGVVATGQRVVFVGGDAPGYRVTSTPLPRVADPASAGLLATAGATGFDGATVDPRYTELPDAVPQRVRDLGRRLVASAPDRRSAVLAVENELRARLEYRLDSPRPRRGEDPVDDVLFRSRSGFCEQFAAAEIVLLRSAGIPARMATGFAGGTPSGDRRILKGSDAHAWVEVWFPGVGWVSSDPTAGARLYSAWWSDLAALWRWLAVNPWRLALALVVVGGLVVGVALLAAWRRSRSRGGVTEAPPPSGREVPAELAAAFARLEAALAEAGRERRPTETVAALAVRVGAGDRPVRDALAVLERALYAAVPPSRSECGTAAGHLDRVSARVLAEVRSGS
jgi:transglutaminase-like putative cysteine protease